MRTFLRHLQSKVFFVTLSISHLPEVTKVLPISSLWPMDHGKGQDLDEVHRDHCLSHLSSSRLLLLFLIFAVRAANG